MLVAAVLGKDALILVLKAKLV